MRRSLNLTIIALLYFDIALITPYQSFTPFEFFTFALAVCGLAWLVTESKIFWPRNHFVTTITMKDYEQVIPNNTLGEILTCPLCAGAWLALGLIWLIALLPEVARVIETIMATIAVIRVVYR